MNTPRDGEEAPVSASGTAGEPRWLTAEQQRDWRATIVGASFLMRALSADLETASGLSMAEYELLVRLSEAPEHRVRMSELADSVAHSRSRVTHTVARLESAGLVARRPAAKDGRGVEAALTERGMRRLEEAAPGHVASVRARLVDVLSAQQLRDLGGAMRAVLEAAGIDALPGGAEGAGGEGAGTEGAWAEGAGVDGGSGRNAGC
ncbi:MarR family transcriptional regulator [Miniimonas arenae]|uniref:MarR family transcriptional regulator n=1 Tax=Miniimonas arenae TaxID=676201 RepID=A0A5C5BEU0_9MICO|nr:MULTISPECIES: MarR family transcriptional regulator [Miniimonas]TNU76743.1 MarR family transcriptional regulator [Miniimonas arenae]